MAACFAWRLGRNGRERNGLGFMLMVSTSLDGLVMLYLGKVATISGSDDRRFRLVSPDMSWHLFSFCKVNC
jgi:hypothetical protein